MLFLEISVVVSCQLVMLTESRRLNLSVDISLFVPAAIEETQSTVGSTDDGDIKAGHSSPILSAVSEYVRSLLGRLYADCLVHGNVSCEGTTQLAEKMKVIIATYNAAMVDGDMKDRKKGQGKEVEEDNGGANRTLGNGFNPPQEVVLLPQDRVVIVCAVPRNPNENNKCVEAYYQLGKWTRGEIE